MKKVFISFVLFSVFLIGGCANKVEEKVIMDQPAEDGKYYYSNNDLDFSLVLPAEFIYYQVQRKQVEYYTDIEYFLPTNDVAHPQEVPSYAKPLVVRIFNKDTYDDTTWGFYEKQGEKDGKVYTLRFWKDIPSDWTDRWNDNLKNEIIASFKVIK